MLCAKYDYKMDISVKQEEAREDGIAIGIQQGAQQKALETAINLLKLNKLSPDEIAFSAGLSVEKILELKEQFTEKA